MDISKKILSDPINKWVFQHAGTEVFLVGGYIRDLLIGRDAYDKDYTLKKNAKQTAIRFAKKFHGTFIELKEELTYRVALNDGQFIDFNNLEKDIEGDLLLRDYTINAMAWSPETGIIDPTGGLLSFKKRTIRMVSPDNIQNDPLRVLRAYRIASQLTFSIDATTRVYLKKYSASLTNSAPERITEETFKLLNSPEPMKYMKLCTQDGIFEVILGLSTRNIKINMDMFAIFDDFRRDLDRSIDLHKEFNQGITKLGLIRIALLLINDKNSNRSSDFGLLRLSNLIKQKIREIQQALDLCNGRITDTKLYTIFRAAGTSVYEIALIMASMRIRKRDRQRIINKAIDYLKIYERHLIDGNEIQKILNIKEGAKIGKIQAQIKEREFKGFFKNKREGREWIISNFT